MPRIAGMKRRRSALDLKDQNDDVVEYTVIQDKDVSDLETKISVPHTITLYPELFKDDMLSCGGLVKGKAKMLIEQAKGCRRPPNMNCRIESFGRICQKFDDRRRQWVHEMGFGGLLNLALDMHLPRQLAYWIMTRIDPINKVMIASDGREFKFSKNQVRWILGIPNGPKIVPTTKTMTEEVRVKVQEILTVYGKTWKCKSSKESSKIYTTVGIPVNNLIMDRLEGYFEVDDEQLFKTLFLILALEMVLCPTQSPRLAADLLPAITCAMDAQEYDWCSLVLSKFIDSVSTFARRFYANGFACGCGGCLIFAVIFYLDRLVRDPIDWNVIPRIKVWNMEEIGKAAKADKLSSGDYGKLGLLDVAYGEKHPRAARDSEGPISISHYTDERPNNSCFKDRRRKGAKRNL